MDTKTTTAEAAKKHSMEELDVAHLAGAFDVAGSLNIHVSKADDYAIGYRMTPVCEMRFPVDTKDMLLGKMVSYCEDNNIPHNVLEVDNKKNRDSKSQVIQIKKLYAIEEFLLPMLDHLVAHYETALIMLEQIIPRLKDDLHKEKEGFYEIMEFADVIRQKSNHQSRSKYDLEYFAKEWSISQ